MSRRDRRGERLHAWADGELRGLRARRAARAVERSDEARREVEWTEERAHEAAQPGAGTLEEAGGGPEGALERAEIRRRVAEAIDTLPAGQRETLILREVEGLSYQEIAEALSGNLCRCTGYLQIVEAIEAAIESRSTQA